MVRPPSILLDACYKLPPTKMAASFNRWYIPIGAVAVHICIGSVYAWSTFNRPILALFPGNPKWSSPPYTTFSTALVLLGLSAAFGGPWVERVGPRVAATAAMRSPDGMPQPFEVVGNPGISDHLPIVGRIILSEGAK